LVAYSLLEGVNYSSINECQVVQRIHDDVTEGTPVERVNDGEEDKG
jgi:hypothetical protein